MELKGLKLVVGGTEDELDFSRIAERLTYKFAVVSVPSLNYFGALQKGALSLDNAPHQIGVIESLDDPLLHIFKGEPKLIDFLPEIRQKVIGDLFLIIDLPLEAVEKLVSQSTIDLIVLNMVEV